MNIARHNMPEVIDKKSIFCPRIKHCIDHVQHRKASPVTERVNETWETNKRILSRFCNG